MTPGPVETPSKPVKMRQAPSPTPQLRLRRAAPGASRLGTEVFSAQDDDSDDGDDVDESMDIDKDK